jgi:hypothetical protein
MFSTRLSRSKTFLKSFFPKGSQNLEKKKFVRISSISDWSSDQEEEKNASAFFDLKLVNQMNVSECCDFRDLHQKVEEKKKFIRISSTCGWSTLSEFRYTRPAGFPVNTE